MRKNKLIVTLFVVVALLLVSVMVLVACDPKEPEEPIEPATPVLSEKLQTVGTAMDKTFSFDASKQLAVDIDFNVSYDATAGKGKDWNYNIVLKGNFYIGADENENAVDDLLFLVKDLTKNEETFRLSLYQDTLYTKYGDKDGFYKSKINDAPIFSAIRKLLNGAVNDQTGTIDLSTVSIMGGSGLFNSILPLLGEFLFSGEPTWVDTGVYQYLTADLDLAMVKTVLPSLLPSLGGLLGIDLPADKIQEVIDPIFAMIPDVTTQVVFTLNGDKFVGLEVKDADVSIDNGAERGIFNFKTNSFSIGNDIAAYTDAQPLPADHGTYIESNLGAFNLEGKIWLNGYDGNPYGWLNYKISASLNVFVLIDNYFDLSDERLADNFLHVDLYYENTTDEETGLKNDLWGNNRYNNDYTTGVGANSPDDRSDELGEGKKSSILSLIWDPDAQGEMSDKIYAQMNMSNIASDEALSGIRDMVLEQGKDQPVLGDVDTWSILLGHTFTNVHTLMLDPYAMLYPDTQQFTNGALPADSKYLAAGRQMLAGAGSGLDVGGMLGMILPMIPNVDSGIVGIINEVFTYINVNLFGTGSALTVNLDTAYAKMAELQPSMGSDLPLNVERVLKDAFGGKGFEQKEVNKLDANGNVMYDANGNAVKETGYERFYAKTLTFSVDKLELWSKVDEDAKNWTAPVSAGVEYDKYPYYYTQREPDGREKDFSKGAVAYFASFHRDQVGGSPIKGVTFNQNLVDDKNYITFYSYNPLSTLSAAGDSSALDVQTAKILDQGGADDALKNIHVAELDRLVGSYLRATYTLTQGTNKNPSNYVMVLGHSGIDKTLIGKPQKITLFLGVVEGNGLFTFLNEGGWVDPIVGGNSWTAGPLAAGGTPLKLVNHSIETWITIDAYDEEIPSSAFNVRHPEQSTFFQGVQLVDTNLVFAPNVSKTINYTLENGDIAERYISLANVSFYTFKYPEKVSGNRVIATGDNTAYITISGVQYSCDFSVAAAPPVVAGEAYQYRITSGNAGGRNAGRTTEHTNNINNYSATPDPTKAYLSDGPWDSYYLLDENGENTVYALSNYIMYVPVGWTGKNGSDWSFGAFDFYLRNSADRISGGRFGMGWGNTYYIGSDLTVPTLPAIDALKTVGNSYTELAKFGVTFTGFNGDGTPKDNIVFNKAGIFWFSFGTNGSLTPNGQCIFRIIVGDPSLSENLFTYESERLSVEFTGDINVSAPTRFAVEYDFVELTGDKNANDYYNVYVNGTQINDFSFVLDPNNLNGSAFKNLVFSYSRNGVALPDGFAGNFALTITLTSESEQVIKLYDRNIRINQSVLFGQWSSAPTAGMDATFMAAVAEGDRPAYVGFEIVYMSGNRKVDASYVDAKLNGVSIDVSKRIMAGGLSDMLTMFDFEFEILKLAGGALDAKIVAYLSNGMSSADFVNAKVLATTVAVTRYSAAAPDFAVNRLSAENGGNNNNSRFNGEIFRKNGLANDATLRIRLYMATVGSNGQTTAGNNSGYSGVSGSYKINGGANINVNTDYTVSALDATLDVMNLVSNNNLTHPKDGNGLSDMTTYQLYMEIIIDSISYGKYFVRQFIVMSSCVAQGTLITLADGSQVPVETLNIGDMLLVWNLYEGKVDVAPLAFIAKHETEMVDIVHFCFSDGTNVKVVGEENFFDIEMGRYVMLNHGDAAKNIGRWYMGANGAVQLVDVKVYQEMNTAYAPVTGGHLCYYGNNMLLMAPVSNFSEGLVNVFEVDTNAMMFDSEKMQEAIDTYGLFTYEEFNELLPISEIMFDIFNIQYFKVSLGKGTGTMEEIAFMVEMINTYQSMVEMINT